MTTKDPKKQNGHNHPYSPGTYVYDVVADAFGRVADPDAYPSEHLGASATLLVPLRGNAPAWQAVADALRPATDDEIKAAR